MNGSISESRCACSCHGARAPSVETRLRKYVEQLLTENARLQDSINRCGTEEGLCYAAELERKDAEIERLKARIEAMIHGGDCK